MIAAGPTGLSGHGLVPRPDGPPSSLVAGTSAGGLLDPSRRLNVADHARAAADKTPEAFALIAGRGAYRRMTFSDLDLKIDRYARGLAAIGVNERMRVLLLLRPSFDLFAVTFALFRMGAIPVFLDPGMGRKRVLGAIREVEPEAMIAVPRGHAARLLFPSAFASARIRVTAGGRFPFGGPTLSDLEAIGETSARDPRAETRAGDVAAVLFTSGSTGAPKGVLYTQAIFDAQVRIFSEELGIGAGEVDLSAFPLFSLFSLALGVTVVIPEMDASRPGRVDPRSIVQSVKDLGVTYAFGSPAFWDRIADHCEAERIELSTVRRILMAGAPAPLSLLERLVRIIPAASEVYTPYGATECLPITMPGAKDLLGGTAEPSRLGFGTNVGRPLARNAVRIIAIDDGAIPDAGEARILGTGEIGEICVQGPTATAGYFRRPKDDAASKMRDGEGFWHRMGDVGRLDGEGRLWFCGRKSQRVETERGPMFTECCEAIFNRHPRVRRSALVGVKGRPVIVVELARGAGLRGRADEAALREELRVLAKSSELTTSIDAFLFHRRFPVDPRHNAKIVREALAIWAERALP